MIRAEADREVIFDTLEKAGADASGGSTDPNGKSHDSSDTVALAHGTTSYTTGDVFDGPSGNEIWMECPKVTATAVVQAPITILSNVSKPGNVIVANGGVISTSGSITQTK